VRPPPLILAFALAAGFNAVADNFEFAVIGDTRPRFESESFKPFEGLISRINEVKPALVVNLGDLIYGYGPASKERQWDKYEATIRQLHVPYYQTPGNHDTHSKDARRVYERRFGKFYQSFDYNDCHFVLLDNTEHERWGYMGPAQLNWLKDDLQRTRAKAVFVFVHFPVWEPERITPEYYEFWAQTLHPLFKESRVRAVFGGHYHTYGPTREFDGIRYYITGGGGAELRPEYRKAGGQYHFMKVKVSGDSFDVRVITGGGELTDPEADVMGGLQFAARNVSRIAINPSHQNLSTGVTFQVSVENPYKEILRGEAAWLMDASAFSVEPASIPVQIPAGAARQYSFCLKSLKETVLLPSLPQLDFNVVSEGRRHRFHREVRFVQQASTPFRATTRLLDGEPVSNWQGIPVLKLQQEGQAQAELRSCYDHEALCLAVSVPAFDADEAKELGFSDELQIGIARSVSETEFGGDLLRLGLDSTSREPRDRTPGRRSGVPIPGAKSLVSIGNGHNIYQISIPLRLLKGLKPGPGKRMLVDVSFLVPEPEAQPQTTEPTVNSLSYRARYGSDSLLPVYFVELNFEPKRQE
jgi:hypothetical protein